MAYARLRHIPNADKRLAIVLSSYPTKHSRVGNAVGLDTPGVGGRADRARCARPATTSATPPRTTATR